MSLKKQLNERNSVKIEYRDLAVRTIEMPDLSKAIDALSKDSAKAIVSALGAQAILIDKLQAAVTALAELPPPSVSVNNPVPKKLIIDYGDGRKVVVTPKY